MRPRRSGERPPCIPEGKAFEALNSPPHAMREYLYACREGVVEACSKAIPATRQEFDPDQWIGYVLYGYEIRSVLGRGGWVTSCLLRRTGSSLP